MVENATSTRFPAATWYAMPGNVTLTVEGWSDGGTRTADTRPLGRVRRPSSDTSYSLAKSTVPLGEVVGPTVTDTDDVPTIVYDESSGSVTNDAVCPGMSPVRSALAAPPSPAAAPPRTEAEPTPGRDVRAAGDPPGGRTTV